jgi:hypothetical protein
VAGHAHADVSHIAPAAAIDDGYADYIIKPGLERNTPIYALVVTNDTKLELHVIATSSTTGTAKLEGNLVRGGEVADGGQFILFTNDIDGSFRVTFTSVATPSLTKPHLFRAEAGNSTSIKDGFKFFPEKGWFRADKALAKPFTVVVEGKGANRTLVVQAG